MYKVKDFCILCGDDSTLYMQDQDLLKQLGLSANETAVYLALLRHKRASVTKLAEDAHLNRTTAYDVLRCLHKKGLILQYVENNKIGFSVDSVKRLKAWIGENKKEVIKREELLDEHLNELERLFRARRQVPRIQFFEGLKQMEDFFLDSLNTESREIIGYVSPILNMTFAAQKLIRLYAKRRINIGIKGRYFVQPSEVENIKKYFFKFYRRYTNTHSGLIRVKVLPETSHHEFLNETSVYGNRFATCHVENDFFGVIIESQRIAATQCAVFESLWKTVKEEIKI